MIYLTALALVLIAHIAYVVVSMRHQQKLIDKLIAKDYQEYKREERADERQASDLKLSELELHHPNTKEEPDRDYL
ncbi:DUF4954 family protein [Cytobacillus oceanisediminis]|uniref:DUF4954 family protein n=1 Tax=Cytobacillus oceanisediminis TaxID=665099 RepID=UPI001C219019|nr:DUF4954 family protein [Cytobacillus oceanisediminis]MBU8770324.1 DUF4954 family protein [Cytobacillus oceanisediminis]